MKVKQWALVWSLVGLLGGLCRIGAIQLSDVLFLSDGSSITGVIMEEEPGKTLVLESEEGELLEFRFKDIERIEKKFVAEQSIIQNRDVVYLEDGVVFRGLIVGRIPDKQITLELEEGQLLHFSMSEVFKITKEQVATGVVKKAVIKPKKAEKQRVEIQIQIVMNQLEVKQNKLKEGGESSEAQGLQDDVDRLKEQIEQLEEQQERVQSDASEEEKRFAEIEGELGEMRSQLLEAAGQLQQSISACDSSQLQKRLTAKYEDLQRNMAEVLQRAEVIALVQQPDPRIEEIELQGKTTDAVAIAQSGLWRKPAYKKQWEALVAELPYQQRRNVYREASKGFPLGSMLFNTIPFAYVGSWRQKDYLGVAIGMGTSLAAAGLLIFNDLYFEESPVWDTILTVGIGTLATAWVFGIIEPIYFNMRHNQKLRDALELDRREAESEDRQIAFKESGYRFPAPPERARFELGLVGFEY